jgi:hypothetical protein
MPYSPALGAAAACGTKPGSTAACSTGHIAGSGSMPPTRAGAPGTAVPNGTGVTAAAAAGGAAAVVVPSEGVKMMITASSPTTLPLCSSE